MGIVDQTVAYVSDNVSVKSAAVFVTASATLYQILVLLDRRRRRNKLGGPAPSAPYKIPLGESLRRLSLLRAPPLAPAPKDE